MDLLTISDMQELNAWFALPDTFDYSTCSAGSPCDYAEGNCQEDRGCQEDLKCGVDNCHALAAGMAGSCCVQLVNSTLSPPVSARRSPTQWSAWGPWTSSPQDSGRARGRVFWPGGDHCEGCDVKLQVFDLICRRLVWILSTFLIVS